MHCKITTLEVLFNIQNDFIQSNNNILNIRIFRFDA